MGFVLKLGKNGRSPGVGGLFVGRKVFGDDTVFGNERKALRAGHHRSFHGEAESSGELAVAIAEELDVSIGST